jgi:hypothetical protein
MRVIGLAVLLVLLTGCAHTQSSDFVEGSIRIVLPVEHVGRVRVMEDGGSKKSAVKDATGKMFFVNIYYGLGSTTRGAIYLLADSGARQWVRVLNEAEFREKVTNQ